jgi:hypothetical protein
VLSAVGAGCGGDMLGDCTLEKNLFSYEKYIALYLYFSGSPDFANHHWLAHHSTHGSLPPHDTTGISVIAGDTGDEICSSRWGDFANGLWFLVLSIVSLSLIGTGSAEGLPSGESTSLAAVALIACDYFFTSLRVLHIHERILSTF